MRTRLQIYHKGRLMPCMDARGDRIGADRIYASAASFDRGAQTHIERADAQSEDHFRATLDNLLDPFVLMEAVRDCRAIITNFRYTYANAAACQAVGRPREELIGRTLRDVMPSHFWNGLFERYRQAADTGLPLVLDGFEYEGEPDGAGRRACLLFDIRVTKIGNGLALTWRDVTERRRMQADLSEVQSRLVDSIETERQNLARVLHDGPVQDLYAIDYQLHGLQLHAIPCADTEALNAVQGMLHQVIDTLLSTVGELRPMTLAPFGLHAAILSYMHDFSDKFPAVQVNLDLDDDHQTLPEGLRLGLFRIFQQIAHNIEHHARASCVGITLKVQADEALLRIVDNGVGFHAPERLVTLARAGQLGLVSAYEQAQRLGGKMEIVSRPGIGTCITVVCPMEARG